MISSMLARAGGAARLSALTLRQAATRVFFDYFFRVLLALVAVAQWGCAWWLVSVWCGVRLPLWAHGVGPVCLFAVNRLLVMRRRGGGAPAALPLRLYSAVAFVSLFCLVFMVAAGILWATARLAIGVLSAGGMPAPIVRDGSAAVNTVFRWLTSMGIVGVAALMAYGYVFGQRRLRVRRVVISLDRTPRTGAKLRIVHISDLHVGRNLRLDELRRFVAAVNALEPELICVTGDIVDSPFADLAAFLPVLSGLRARWGTYAILGNHDHYAGPFRVRAALARWTSLRVLCDEAQTLTLGENALHIIGLDDRGRDWARGLTFDPKLEELLQRAPPTLPIVLLSHRPDAFAQAAKAGVALTLAGHTHGGQLAIPWPGGRYRNLAELMTPFDRGLYRRDGSYLYVNCGLGVTGQRVRLFTPREVTLIELNW